MKLAAWVTLAAAALAATGAAGTAAAQDAAASYPDKPIRIIVATGPGGPTDFMARAVADGLTKQLGQQVVVDNRGGAGGALAVTGLIEAPADGYTLLVSHAGPIVINKSLFTTELPYDPEKDLVPVSHLSNMSSVLLVRNDLPVKTFDEFVAYAKEHPGELNFASTGTGAMPHLTGERFKLRTGIEATHIPYKTAPEATTAVLTGEVDYGWNSPDSLKLVEAGKMKALTTTADKRFAFAPDLPTVDEVGLKGFRSGAWYGLYAPTGTDPAIVDKIAGAVAKTMEDPALREKAEAIGFEIIGSDPAAAAEHVKAETASWKEVVEKTGLKVQN